MPCKLALISLLVFTFLACQESNKQEKHVFYLHPAIVEQEGWNAIHPRFGSFDGDAILEYLASANIKLYADQRDSTVDFYSYTERLDRQVDSLISNKVKPEDISIIGASKGGVIAMYLSHLNHEPINYVFLASNTVQIDSLYDWSLNGRILAIIEETDSIAFRTYESWIEKSPNILEFKEIKVSTGLNHGIVLKADKQWLNPTKDWIK